MTLMVRFNSVKVLTNVIRDVDDVLPQRDLTSQQKKDLDEIARGCHDVLNQLKEKLEKSHELDSKAKGANGKSRRVWKRFRWDQTEIDQFRNRVGLNITAFNTFLGRITRYHLSPLVIEKARSSFVPAMWLLQQRPAWICYMSDRITVKTARSIGLSWIGSLRLTMLLSRMISSAGDRREPGDGCWIQTSSRGGVAKCSRHCSVPASRERARQ